MLIAPLVQNHNTYLRSPNQAMRAFPDFRLSLGRAGCGPGRALPFPELDPADLAADRLGQLGDEFDLPGVLVGSRDRLDVLLKLTLQRRRRLVAAGQDDESLDDL